MIAGFIIFVAEEVSSISKSRVEQFANKRPGTFERVLGTSAEAMENSRLIKHAVDLIALERYRDALDVLRPFESDVHVAPLRMSAAFGASEWRIAEEIIFSIWREDESRKPDNPSYSNYVAPLCFALVMQKRDAEARTWLFETKDQRGELGRVEYNESLGLSRKPEDFKLDVCLMFGNRPMPLDQRAIGYEKALEIQPDHEYASISLAECIQYRNPARAYRLCQAVLKSSDAGINERAEALAKSLRKKLEIKD